jgi:hypothetical protein
MADQKLNPQIRKVQIGVRELKEITIYPLSIADQMKMVDILKNVFDEIFKMLETDDQTVAIANVVIEQVKANLPELLKYVTDETVELEDMTNFQFTTIVGHVYKDNFEDAGKNVSNLVGAMKNLFSSTRSLQQ